MIQYLKTHVFYVALLLVLLVAGRSWLLEHDARLLSDQQAKISDSRVQALYQQIEANKAAAHAAIDTLQKQAAAVKTASQAIIAIPDVSTLSLNSRPLPDNPNQVAVDAIPLYQTLNQCKQDAVELNACKANAKLTTEQLTEKDTEIKALKKPKKFWSRVGSTLKTGGVGVILGIAIKAALL